MTISKLRIENFKGIRDLTEFEIRPITLFIGPNSSGKSSCIHALAALAQTSKLPSSGRPLVLDDEYALVHLGRFIEVIHSKSYTDPISIGFETNDVSRSISSIGKARRLSTGDRFAADYSFRSTKRTQDTYLDQFAYSSPTGNLLFQLDKKANQYAVKYEGTSIDVSSRYETALNASVVPKDTKLSGKEFDALFYNDACRQIVASELSKVLYLGPFRQSPLRRYPTRGSSPTEVGAQGENAVTLLANEFVQTKSRPHLKEIGEWLHQMGLAKTVEVARVGKSDLFDVNVTLSDGVSLPIADLGYGMSQVLPVLAQCSFAQKKSTLLFEQPELHLNHTAAKLLSGVFVSASNEKSLHIVAETHSRELFLGLLDQIRLGKLAPKDLAIYTVNRENGCSRFKRITVDVDEHNRPDVSDPWDTAL